ADGSITLGAISTGGGNTTDRAEAATGGPEMTLTIESTGSCDDPIAPTVCNILPGDTFLAKIAAVTIPASGYIVQGILEGLDFANESLYSDPLEVANSRWADCCGPFTGTEFPPPDGIIDLVTDCRAFRDKVADNPVAPITARIDVEPKVPDQRVTVTDVLDALDAFRGLPYPPLRFGPPGPRPCEP
ncbi:MAG: hypothetical protein IH988_08720, partial [Planctomycetes bacterium]|nr:hypothetical protein [Planctomycetota bacterium]